MFKKQSKAYIVAVDMGYGHQRAVQPLEFLAMIPPGWEILPSKIIPADNYPSIPKKDKLSWAATRRIYEIISRLRSLPLIGSFIFGIMDYVQRIESFYPKRDLSKPTLQTKQIYRMIKAGLGRDLIDKLNNNPLSFLTSFFIPAIFAEEHGYKGEIYCLCTDTDISRAWVPLKPANSRIIYLAPSQRVFERLLMYGIREEKIIMTGFPLPLELQGERDSLSITKESLGRRVKKLDPKGIFREKYEALVSEYLVPSDTAIIPIDLTFAVGGAGAQVEIGEKIINSLAPLIKTGMIKLNLIAGISELVRNRFLDNIASADLIDSLAQGDIFILYEADKFEYFRKFNSLIKLTDILWTKPCELSFYSALGLPILIAPPLGSQERFNREWLLSIGSGIDQGIPSVTSNWLLDLINSGKLAEAAVNGFVEAPKYGTYNIKNILNKNENN